MPRFLIVLSLLSFSASAAVLSPEVPVSAPRIAPAPHPQHVAGIATNGRDFLAIWSDRRAVDAQLAYAPPPLYVSRVDRTGKLLRPFGLKLRDSVYAASVVWTAAGYMLLWSETNEVDAMLLDNDGVPISAPKKLTGGYLSAAASNGRSVFVVHDRFASIFNLDGSVRSETALRYNDWNIQTLRAFVTSDSQYALAVRDWNCNGNEPCAFHAVLIRVSESGGMSMTPLAATLSQSSQVTAMSAGGRLLLAWMNDTLTPNPRHVIQFRIFDEDGHPLTDETTVADTNVIAAMGAFVPSVGWDGREFLIAWQWTVDPTGQSGEIRAVRVMPDGMVDSAPFVLSLTLGNVPFFASNGLDQIVAYDTGLWVNSDIVIRSAMSFDRLNDAPISVVPESSTLQTEAQVANNLIVWREGDENRSIDAAILGGFPVTLAQSSTVDLQTPAVATNGNEYLVAWREESTTRFRIVAKRVALNGIVIDNDPIFIADMAAPWPPYSPTANTISIASDSANFFVTWTDGHVYGARVSADGSLLDAKPTAVSDPRDGISGSPRAIWTGSQFLVAWTADRSCRLCGRPPDPPNSQMYVARVARDGTLLGEQQAWSGGASGRIALARAGDSAMLAWGVAAGTGGLCTYALPLGLDGRSYGAAQTLACTASPSYPPSFTDFDLAWDGAAFVAVWSERTPTAMTAKAIRVSVNGTAEDPAPFDVAPSNSIAIQPAVTSSPAGVVVAYGRIADEPQYGGVARIFTRELQRITAPAPRRRGAR